MRVLFICITMLGLAWACNQQDDPSDVILQQPPYALLTDSIRQQPANPELYYKRGILLQQNNHHRHAAADLLQAWNLHKQEPYAVSLANLLGHKHADSAILFIQRALQTLPQSVALQILLANNYQQKNEIGKAIAVCDEILQRHPAQLDALELKARLLQAQNKKAEALAVLEKAYAYAPFDAELAYQLAFEYAESKNPKALTLSDSLIRKDASGSHAEPYYFKGVYYSNTGNDKQALAYFNLAIQHDYYFLDAYMEKGRLLYQQKKYKTALATFQLAATVSPAFADAYFWQGRVEEAMGNKEEAKLNYQRAYGLDKTLTEAKQAEQNL